MKWRTVNCSSCGRSFETLSSRVQCGSCASLGRKPMVRSCVECGTSFVAKKESTRRTCSDRCRAYYTTSRYIEACKARSA